MNLWLIFLTGLTIGGLTCLAVQGGLLASVIAARQNENDPTDTSRKNSFIPTLTFLGAKLIAYILLGFFLGAFGQAVGINQTIQIVMQLIAGLYMFAIACNLLNLHPIFRYAVIQPPKFLTRLVRNQSKSKDLFAPFMLGAMTIFIPCGTTLAMEAMAISSANPFTGAAILAAFVMGTAPLFLGLGWLTSIMGENFRGAFSKVAAVAVLYLALTSINGALIALDFPINSQRLQFLLTRNDKSEVLGVSQNVEIIVGAGGYSPNVIRVKKGVPVTITLIGKSAYSCASAFRVPQLGIVKNLEPNETYSFSFTPDSIGPIRFMCSMGMYTGIIDVI
jgi:sulfite exporter TauE/SafE